ncbi:MAG: GNAT family N-acetyltransferase [Burkholderiales bacterium]|nr:GNAT family N-acetyltransferase [Burkholderiales bacterium]
MHAATTLRITPASAASDDARLLITALDAYLDSLYPPEENYLLDIDALCQPEVSFMLAHLGDEAVGCGAIVARADYAEVKRMFVLPTARGQGIAGQIVAALESAARTRGLTHLRLETGTLMPDAQQLYARCGFGVCGPFGEYVDNGASVFMEKRLG